MRKIKSVFVAIACLISMLSAAGCDSAEGNTQDESGNVAETDAEDKEKNAYDEYIKSAIETVGGTQEQGEPTKAPEQEKNTINITTDRTAPSDLQISSMEDPDSEDPYADDPFASPTYDPDESPSPTEDPNATPTPTPTPYITPEEFDVDKCCIYINGESDSAYGTEVVTAINKVREDLGYKKLVSNKGLATCGDRRTREIAANFSHTRPNGKFFTSVAPEHFRAEMLIIDNQKAENTVDDLIKRDPISRNLIFTEKYQSIGASSFKCNGMRYTVVAFGL